MEFELCIPAYNESEIIEESVARVRAALEQDLSIGWGIIVSDNASTDGTGERAAALADKRIRVVRTEEKGKGCAILAAARQSQAEYFGFIDADLSVEPSHVASLLAPLLKDEADIVIGSRLLDTRTVKRSALRTASSRIFNGLRRVAIGVRVADSQCGLKVMNARARSLLHLCEETGWFLDMEFLARAERAGLRIKEVPVAWDEQRFSGRESKLRVVRDGFGALGAMARIYSRLG